MGILCPLILFKKQVFNFYLSKNYENNNKFNDYGCIRIYVSNKL